MEPRTPMVTASPTLLEIIHYISSGYFSFGAPYPFFRVWQEAEKTNNTAWMNELLKPETQKFLALMFTPHFG